MLDLSTVHAGLTGGFGLSGFDRVGFEHRTTSDDD